MVPSIDTRLRSVAKAIEQVIIPALPADQRLAIEQAEIAIGHLRVLETQWRFVAPITRLELRYLVELARALLGSANGGSDRDMICGLDAALSVDADDFEALRSVVQQLGEAVERFIERSDGLLSDMGARAAILRHARLQAGLERSWFAAAGISDTAGVSDIAELLAAEGSSR